MLKFGRSSHDSHQKPSSLDRWLVGALAGAAVVYLLGKGLGLGHNQASKKANKQLKSKVS
jgi:hypothetical protein